MNEQPQSQNMSNNYYRKNSIRPWIITGIVVAVVMFFGLWGIGTVNKQRAAQITASSEKAFAPDFTLPATTGGAITLSDFRGKKNVLLYFHEGLSCQPCWEQIPELEKGMTEFEKINVALLSVALDPVEKWKDTIDQYKIKTSILSYANADTDQDYNLLPFSMGMGRRAGHTFVLIGTDGTIKWRRDYWPSRGHMVAGGTMFVESRYIVEAVKKVLNQ